MELLRRFRPKIAIACALVSFCLPLKITASSYLSPTTLAATKNGKTLYVACATADRLLCVDVETRKVISTIVLPAASTGFAFSPDESVLFVTCSGPEGKVCVVDLSKNKIIARIAVGHTPNAPVISPDGKTLFVCNSFNDDVSIVDVKSRKELRRIPAQRQPVAAALTKDSQHLLVANLVPSGRSDGDLVTTVISVIDVVAGKANKEIQLPNGSSGLHDICVSPDGKYAAIPHIIARFQLPTTQLERGWINANALTLVDLSKLEVLNTVLLDNVERGAANPWGVSWTSDGSRMVITHSGTHELSIIDFPGLLAKLNSLPVALSQAAPASYSSMTRIQADVPNDLSFLVGLRQFIKLGSDLGPRSVVCIGNTAVAANYFSDTLSLVELAAASRKVESIPLGPKVQPDLARKGEMYFNDATICFQSWQSCASCHPGEARSDNLNWDLLNDGMGNAKNTKSLLLAHQTPPSMSLGKRDTAETAVRAGISYILFSQQPEEVALAMDAYLKSLKPVPSPFLTGNKLSRKAKRGAEVFSRAGCAQCHPPGLYTDLEPHDVGTLGKFDKPADRIDTPTLVELWRTAPYLHDGSAATIREVITYNSRDLHGKTSNLSPQEIDELCEYLLSL